VSDFTQTEAVVGAVVTAVNGADAPKPEITDAAPDRVRDAEGKFLAGVRSTETQAKEREAWAKVLEAEKPPAAPAAAPKKEESTPEVGKAAAAGEKPKETVAQGKAQEKAPLAEDPAQEQAIKALRLDGYKTEDLAVLGAERIKSLGLEAAKRQASYSQKLDELSRKASASAPATPKAGEPASAQAPVSQPPDLRAVVKGFAETLGLSTEEGEPALTKFAEAITSPLRAELDQSKKLIDSMMNVLVVAEAMEARGKLPEDIRGLTDDAEFKEKVVPKALSLWSKRSEGEYDSFVDALSDAQTSIASGRILQEAASLRARKAEQREHGQLSSIDQRTPPKARSTEERQRAAFQVIARGGSEEDARAAYGA
jgi:hypothetical protein